MRAQPQNRMLFLSASTLFKALNRKMNEPFIPKHNICESHFMDKYLFSCDGNIYFCDCINEGENVIGTYYPHISINEEEVRKLANRSVLNNKCKNCPYKFVCLGGCPLSAQGKNQEFSCGIFADEDVLDNLEFNYYWIPRQ